MGAATIFIPQYGTHADRIVTVTNGAGQSLVLTSAGTVTMSITPTAGGASASGLDTLNVKTNADGYQLYLSMNNDAEHGNRLYKDGDNTTTDYLSPVSGTFSTPDILQNNTWGFAIASDSGVFDSSYQTPTPASTSKWAAVPLRSNAQLIKSSNQEAPDPGDNIPVYYGVKATTALSSGIYSNIIAYTAVISGGSIQDIAAIAPERTDNLRGGETITISTSLSATAANVGTVSVKIGDQACTNATASNSGSGQINITCKTPAMNTGKYDVTVEIPDYNKLYFIPEGFEYYVDTTGPMTEFNITDMQEMTPEVCMAAEIGTEAILKDTRDNKAYRVRKMENGRCWMLQNLALGDMGTSYVLTPDDTDITSKLTIGSNAIVNSGNSQWWGTNESAINTLHIYDNGDTWIQPTSSGSNATVNTSGSPPSQSQYIGNYYNWYTATAGTGTYASLSGNAHSSICPKGWKLPVSSEFANLNETLVEIANNTSNVPTQSFTLQSPPNYFVLSGFYDGYNGGIREQGIIGRWWSSTASNTGDSHGTYAFYMYLTTSSVYPQHQGVRSNGLPVRCIAADPFRDTNGIMQNMTTEICTNSYIGDEKILKDTRDNNTYTVRKMEDGNCWMTQNLQIGSTSTSVTLTPNDSDVSSDYTISSSAVASSVGNTKSGIYTSDTTWIQLPVSPGIDATVKTSGVPPSQSQYIGNYYGDGIAARSSGSICPKGWKLPADSEFRALVSSIVGTATDADASYKLQSPPYYFILSGGRSSALRRGTSGSWWTSTPYASSQTYALIVNKNSVYVDYFWTVVGSGGTSYAVTMSVRCMAR